MPDSQYTSSVSVFCPDVFEYGFQIAVCDLTVYEIFWGKWVCAFHDAEVEDVSHDTCGIHACALVEDSYEVVLLRCKDDNDTKIYGEKSSCLNNSKYNWHCIWFVL